MHIRDGDTIEVAGIAIRFGPRDCAERDTREGQAATARMRELVSGQSLTLSCALNRRSSHDRKIGSCRLLDGQDLAAIMIREGYSGRFWCPARAVAGKRRQNGAVIADTRNRPNTKPITFIRLVKVLRSSHTEATPHRDGRDTPYPQAEQPAGRRLSSCLRSCVLPRSG